MNGISSPGWTSLVVHNRSNVKYVVRMMLTYIRPTFEQLGS